MNSLKIQWNHLAYKDTFVVVVLTKYDDDWWFHNFHTLTKGTLFDIANQLKLLIQKQDMKYQFVIPMEVCVTCAIYKLTQGVNLLICSELFVISRSIISFIVQKVITFINIGFKNLITWPFGSKMDVVMTRFKSCCNLLNVEGVINNIHFAITKLISPLCEGLRMCMIHN
jgi:hypothetical protein